MTSTQAVLELDADTSAHSLLSIVHFEGSNKAAMAMLASAGQQAMQEAEEAAEAEAAALAEEQVTQESEASGDTSTPFWRRAARVALGAVAVVAVAVVAVKLAPLVVAAVAKTAIAGKVAAGASAAVATISSTAIGGAAVSCVATALTAVGAASSTILGKAVLTGLSVISTAVPGASYFSNIWNWDERIAERGFYAHLSETVGLGIATGTGLASTFTSAQSLVSDIRDMRRAGPPGGGGRSNSGLTPDPSIPEPPMIDPPDSIPGGLVREGLGEISGNQYHITQQHIDIVEHHLFHSGRFEPDPSNAAMIGRLQNALNRGETITGADASFLLHELNESMLMRRGLDYNRAHREAIALYRINDFSVYHPDVIRQFAESFGSSWFRFWDISR